MTSLRKVLDHAPPEIYGPASRISPRRKPEGFSPAVQRYSALMPEKELFVGFFGFQSFEGVAATSAKFSEWIQTNLIKHEQGPSTHDYSQFTDRAGYTNHVVSAYWVHQSNFEAWRGDGRVNEFWTSPDLAKEDMGHWREIMRVPVDRFESIYWIDYQKALSSDDHVQLYPTPFCGYYGAMRDRIVIAAVDKLVAIPQQDPPHLDRVTSGTTWRVQPPHNMAVIRSAYSWGLMDQEQKEDFDRRLAPPLGRGMDFLKENPEASGCFAIRTQRTTDVAGVAQPEGHATAFFRSLRDMEQWSEGHKTHAAIFGAAIQRYKHYGSRNQLRTWHEVWVLPDDREQVFEYINCHSETGLLAHFQGHEVE